MPAHLRSSTEPRCGGRQAWQENASRLSFPKGGGRGALKERQTDMTHPQPVLWAGAGETEQQSDGRGQGVRGEIPVWFPSLPLFWTESKVDNCDATSFYRNRSHAFPWGQHWYSLRNRLVLERFCFLKNKQKTLTLSHHKATQF